LLEEVPERIERHTVRFTEHAEELPAAGRHLKRGLLLHGLPGTGKTLTAMYLVGRMPERTTLVLSSTSYGLVSPTCELACNLQPSMVILEDVYLVAEERGIHGREPAALRAPQRDGRPVRGCRRDLHPYDEPSGPARAHARRAPGPCGSGHRDTSAGCRRRLISLYGEGLDLRLEDIEGVVTRTNGTSASFIKELLSRATLLAAEEGGELMVADRHVGEALGVMLVAGGTLTMRLLGGSPLPPDASSSNWFEDVDDGPPGSIPG
jgi:DNA polymerase III delta prime subunit